MGAAATALRGDVTSGYWNPAALSELAAAEAGVMHAERFAGVVRYDWAAFAWPLAREGERTHGFALTLIRQGVGGIRLTELVDPDRPPVYVDEETGDLVLNTRELGTGSDAEYQLSLSYGTPLGFRDAPVAVGGTVKGIYKQLVGHTAWGVGLDVAGLFTLPGSVRAGFVLRDLTLTPVVWDTGQTDWVVPGLRLGASRAFRFDDRRGLVLAADAQLLFEGRRIAAQWNLGGGADDAGITSVDFYLGAEMRLDPRVAVRAGLDAGRFTAGGTFTLGAFDIDYAIRTQADLDDTHRVGVRYRFGSPRPRDPATAALREDGQ